MSCGRRYCVSIASPVRATSSTCPRDRLGAILRASFGPENFARDTIAAWLNFYVLAQSNAEAAVRQMLCDFSRFQVCCMATPCRYCHV